MEIAILKWFQSLNQPLLNEILGFLTNLANHGEIWIMILLVLMLFKKTRKIALFAALALIIEYGLNDLILKPFIARARPFTTYPFTLLIKAPSGFSFPSGHSASSFAVALTLYFLKAPGRTAYVILAFVLALSRLYFVVHWPTDVLAGMLLGTAIAFLISRIAIKLNQVANV